MIAATDIVTLAPGVDIRQELLRDVVRGIVSVALDA